MKTKELLEALVKAFREDGIALYEGMPHDWEYLVVPNRGLEDVPVTSQWMVYMMPGGSEGYYLHVEAKTEDETILVILGKTCGPLNATCERVLWAATRAFDASRPRSCILPE